jgi:hypothetical protein
VGLEMRNENEKLVSPKKNKKKTRLFSLYLTKLEISRSEWQPREEAAEKKFNQNLINKRSLISFMRKA